MSSNDYYTNLDKYTITDIQATGTIMMSTYSLFNPNQIFNFKSDTQTIHPKLLPTHAISIRDYFTDGTYSGYQ